MRDPGNLGSRLGAMLCVALIGALAMAEEHSQLPLRDSVTPENYRAKFQQSTQLADQLQAQGNRPGALSVYRSMLQVDDPSWLENPEETSLRISRDLNVAAELVAHGFHDHAVRVLNSASVAAELNDDPQIGYLGSQIDETIELVRSSVFVSESSSAQKDALETVGFTAPPRRPVPKRTVARVAPNLPATSCPACEADRMHRSHRLAIAVPTRPSRSSQAPEQKDNALRRIWRLIRGTNDQPEQSSQVATHQSLATPPKHNHPVQTAKVTTEKVVRGSAAGDTFLEQDEPSSETTNGADGDKNGNEVENLELPDQMDGPALGPVTDVDLTAPPSGPLKLDQPPPEPDEPDGWEESSGPSVLKLPKPAKPAEVQAKWAPERGDTQEVASPEAPLGDRKAQIGIAGLVNRPGIFSLQTESVDLKKLLEKAGGAELDAIRLFVVRSLNVPSLTGSSKAYYFHEVALDGSEVETERVSHMEVVLVGPDHTSHATVALMPHFLLQLPVESARVTPALVVETMEKYWPGISQQGLGILRKSDLGRPIKLTAATENAPLDKGDVLYLNGADLDASKVEEAARSIAKLANSRIRRLE